MSTLDAASLPSSDSEDEDFVVSDHEDQPSTSAAKAQATAAQAGPKRGAPKQQVSPDAALAERLNSIGELLDDVRPAPAKAGASDTSTSLTQLAAQARKLGAKGLKVNKAKGIKGNAKARSTPSGVVAHILARGTAAQDKPAKAGKKRARTAVSAEALAFAEASLAKAGTGRLQLTQKVRYAGKDVEYVSAIECRMSFRIPQACHAPTSTLAHPVCTFMMPAESRIWSKKVLLLLGRSLLALQHWKQQLLCPILR